MQSDQDAKLHSTRRLPNWLFAAILASALSLVASRIYERFHPTSESDLIQWHTPKEVLPTGKSAPKWVLYDFSATWCGPCKLMDKKVFRDPSTSTWINKLVFPIKVVDRTREDGTNTPEIKALQEKYKVDAFPTLVLDQIPSQDKAKTMVGYQGEMATTQFLRSSISQLGGTSADLAFTIVANDALLSISKTSGPFVWKGMAAGILKQPNGQPMSLEEKSFFKSPVIHLGPENPKKIVVGKATDAKGFSGDLRIVVTDQTLYILAKVSQDHPPLNYEETDSLYWGDSVEVFISGIPEKGKTRPLGTEPTDYYFIMAPTSRSGQPAFRSDRALGVKISSTTKSWGYILTVSIPLSNFPGNNWMPGKTYRFDCAIIRGSKKGERAAKIFWNSESDDAWRSPDLWGLAKVK